MYDAELAPQLEEANNKIKRLESLIDKLEVKLHKSEKLLEQVKREKIVQEEKLTEHAKKVRQWILRRKQSQPKKNLSKSSMKIQQLKLT